jgi:hypothetical protein
LIAMPPERLNDSRSEARSKSALVFLGVLAVMAAGIMLKAVPPPKLRAQRYQGVNSIRQLTFTFTNTNVTPTIIAPRR